MGMVIKAARGKLRGKRFEETELQSLVHARLRQVVRKEKGEV
jgi:hypothetical protein